MSDNQAYISQKNTLFLKGVSILCIMLHNFFHLLPPVSYQNEMTFQFSLFQFIGDFCWEEAVNAFFSYFGFYGVYMFIFLSGYGLTKSFLRQYTGGGIIFVIKHIIKIYILFLCSAGIFILFKFPNVNYKTLLLALSLTSNFSPTTLYAACGSWWFFSLIIQLYLLFLFLFAFIKKNKTNIFLLWFAYIAIALLWTKYNDTTINLYANAVGHIPEFSLGVFIALYEKELAFLFSKKFNLAVLAVSLAVLLLAQMSPWLFVFSFTASVAFGLSLFQLIGWKNNAFLEFTGKISPYLFGFNGFLWRYDFLTLANNSHSAGLKIAYFLAWAAINYAAAYIAYWLLCRKKCSAKNFTSATSKF